MSLCVVSGNGLNLYHSGKGMRKIHVIAPERIEVCDTISTGSAMQKQSNIII